MSCSLAARRVLLSSPECTGWGLRGSDASATSCYAVLQQALAEGPDAQIEAGAEPPSRPSSSFVAVRPATSTVSQGDPVYDALATWRRGRAAEEGVPAFHVFANRVLAAVADAKPRTRADLLALPGIGPAKLDRYGDEVLEVVANAADTLSTVG